MKLTRLRAVRQRTFISQQALAEKSGVAEATINRLEQGLRVPGTSPSASWPQRSTSSRPRWLTRTPRRAPAPTRRLNGGHSS